MKSSFKEEGTKKNNIRPLLYLGCVYVCERERGGRERCDVCVGVRKITKKRRKSRGLETCPYAGR